MSLKESSGGEKLENRLEGRALLEHLLERIDQYQQDLEAARKTWDQAKTVKEQARKGGESFDIEQEAKEYIGGYLDKIFALGPQNYAEKIIFQDSVRRALNKYDWKMFKQILSELKEQMSE